MPQISEFVNDAAKNLWSHDVNFVTKNAVSTGYKELDQKLGGFERGGVYLLGGVPGIGTTAMAIDIIYKIAVKEGHRVFYHTNQTSAGEITKRLLCRAAKVSHVKEEAGAEADVEISEATERLKESSIYLSDARRKRIPQILEDEYSANGGKTFDLIIIDDLEGLYDAGPANEELCSCKILAKDYNCPICSIVF